MQLDYKAQIFKLRKYPLIFSKLLAIKRLLHSSELSGKRYSTTRFAMYKDLQKFLEHRKLSGKVLLISEGNEKTMRQLLPEQLSFESTSFPKTDIMNLENYHRDSFDIVVTDQVLEHVPDPFRAVEEIHRVLKPNGLAINTSCAFNPIHEKADFFRFTKAGFLSIHRPFRKILLIGAWGNKTAIGRFVTTGYKSPDVRGNYNETRIATFNESDWPWTVWCVARK